jgi:hypothetical protein
MANVNVVATVKYRVTRKSGNKEVSQKTYKRTINFGEVSEAAYAALKTYTDAAVSIADLTGD